MQTTENNQFRLFEPSDYVVAESFNENTLLLEQCLAKRPIVVTGTYVGKYSEEGQTRRSLTFEKKPLLVVISGNECHMIAQQGAPFAAAISTLNNGVKPTSTYWEGNTFSWYNANSHYMCNLNNYPYYYTAFLEG